MPTLLVVDDDPTIREMFSRSLGAIADVEQAEGGKQALSMLSHTRYETILLDLHMPGVDGFTVLEELGKEEHLNRETPVFVVTGDTTEQARLRAMRLRSLFLLTKPVPLVMLKSLVESAVKKMNRMTPPPKSPPPRNKP